jgi:chromosome segregation ATPase
MQRRWIVYGTSAMVAGAVGGALLAPRPVRAVNRQIVELQQRVEQLIQNQEDLMTATTQNYTAKKTLIGLSRDSVNKFSETMGALQKSTQDVQANSGAQLDAMSTEVQRLSDNLHEILARAGKFDQQIADSENTLRGTDAKLADAAPAPPVTRHRTSRTPPRIRANHE